MEVIDLTSDDENESPSTTTIKSKIEFGNDENKSNNKFLPLFQSNKKKRHHSPAKPINTSSTTTLTNQDTSASGLNLFISNQPQSLNERNFNFSIASCDGFQSFPEFPLLIHDVTEDAMRLLVNDLPSPKIWSEGSTTTIQPYYNAEIPATLLNKLHLVSSTQTVNKRIILVREISNQII